MSRVRIKLIDGCLKEQRENCKNARFSANLVSYAPWSLKKKKKKKEEIFFSLYKVAASKRNDLSPSDSVKRKRSVTVGKFSRIQVSFHDSSRVTNLQSGRASRSPFILPKRAYVVPLPHLGSVRGLQSIQCPLCIMRFTASSRRSVYGLVINERTFPARRTETEEEDRKSRKLIDVGNL